MTKPEPVPATSPGIFIPGEPVWALEPDGPRYGQTVWDFGPLKKRKSQAERRIDFRKIPSSYRTDAADLLMVLAQPDHPAVVEAGVVRRDGPAPTSAVYDAYVKLRILARWGTARSLQSFGAWMQPDCDALLADLQAGRHRQNGFGLSPGTIRGYIELLRLVRDCYAVLPAGLSFRPWGMRYAVDISGQEKRGVDNDTAPLEWGLWAPLLAASWTVLDQWSADIIAAARTRRDLPAEPAGPGGSNAMQIIAAWDANGGQLPLHTGFGRSPGQCGDVNTRLLCRQLRINDSIFNRANHNYRQAAADILVVAARDPARGISGGLVTPAIHVAHEDGTQTPWIEEIGQGEAEHFASVLRAACYIIIACLTGMRDGEIQELRRDSVTMRDGLPALAAIQHKGNDDLEGEARTWWAPEPVIRACQVLAEVSPHPDYLFARNATNAGSYSGDRDIPRLIAFVNDDPQTRPGRGSGLGLRPINTMGADSINADTLRRSFAVYATTKPGAELGLGIQLGHSAWRMTSGYFSDGQQQAVRHLDATRKGILRKQAAALILDGAPVVGPAARHITAFRAQVVSDPTRADHIAETVAGRLHFGLTNDCMWNASTSGCGSDGPHLGDHICVGLDCANALLTQAHTPVLHNGINRIDAYLDRERKDEAMAQRMRRDRANLIRTLRDLGYDPSTLKEE
ncbi:hypothetical protein [Arthrobacter sp. VKM Ac-2550]|uniref:hypothetical protein n=1 Tax=Crystallibacter permensis TaxID=1938888 RepID=UPI0022279BAD|nr:hypothetical protein [Arthrobacter sp. VKM Ac-2550]MCW2132712.1 hypothetical protein [Arthrobacter sp. VKM Ac-2550]